MRRFPGLVLLTVLLVAIVVSLATVIDVLVDRLWFDALGFGVVFMTMWKAKLAVFGLTGSLASGALALNVVLAYASAIRQCGDSGW